MNSLDNLLRNDPDRFDILYRSGFVVIRGRSTLLAELRDLFDLHEKNPYELSKKQLKELDYCTFPGRCQMVLDPLELVRLIRYHRREITAYILRCRRKHLRSLRDFSLALERVIQLHARSELVSR